MIRVQPTSKRIVRRVLVAGAACLALGALHGQTQEAPRGLRIIVVDSEPDALRLAREIRNGASFRALAARHSTDPSAVRQGVLGRFLAGDLRVEYRAALTDLAAGVVSDPVPTTGGFALLEWMIPEEEAWIARRDRGILAVREGRYADAEILFETALRESESSGTQDLRLAESLTDMAELRRVQGRTEAVAPLFERALEIQELLLGPDHSSLATLLNDLAELYRLRGDAGRAGPLYRRVIDIWEVELGSGHPNVAGTFNNLALVRRMEGDLDGARNLFNRSLSIWEGALGPMHPQVALTLNNLAALEEARGRYAEAEAHRRRSLGIFDRVLSPNDPARIRTLENLAHLVRLQDRHPEAIELYRELLPLVWGTPEANDPEALSGPLEILMEVLSGSLTGAPDLDDRILRLADSISHAPVAERWPVNVGRLLTTAGLSAAADRVLEVTAERFPASRLVLFERAELNQRLGRVEAALAGYERALDLEGGSPPAAWIHARMGDAYMELSRGEEALDAYHRASMLDPEDAEYRVRIGDAYTRLGRHEQALGEYTVAVDLDTGLAAAHTGVAESSLQMNRFDDVVEATRRAIGLDNENRRIRYLQGLALLRLGREEAGREAMAEYERLGADARIGEARLLETVVATRDAIEAHREGNDDRAIELLEAAIVAVPDARRVALTLGLIQFEAGRYPEAVTTLSRMIDEGFGDDSLLQWSLIRAHRRDGNSSAAERHEALFLERIQIEFEANSNG